MSTSASPAEIAKASSLASTVLKAVDGQARNAALTAIHAHLEGAKDEILAANRKDLEEAERAAKEGKLSQSLIKRLDLTRPGKWEDMLQGILDVRDLEDPGKRSRSKRIRSPFLTIVSWQSYFSNTTGHGLGSVPSNESNWRFAGNL